MVPRNRLSCGHTRDCGRSVFDGVMDGVRARHTRLRSCSTVPFEPLETCAWSVPRLTRAETRRYADAIPLAAELAPDASVERFERSGHIPMVQEPERFNRRIAEFVADR